MPFINHAAYPARADMVPATVETLWDGSRASIMAGVQYLAAEPAGVGTAVSDDFRQRILETGTVSDERRRALRPAPYRHSTQNALKRFALMGGCL